MPSPHDLICSVLREERPIWPSELADAVGVEKVRHHAAVHGVEVLLHARLATLQWPQEISRSMRNSAIQHAVWELRHQQLLAATLAALHGSGIQPVLIKGTSLAYSVYPDPATRTRGDTDLIVAQSDKARVHEMLLARGFAQDIGVSGDFVSYQASYGSVEDGGAHRLDLHWKFNNSQLLSTLFSYDELRSSAEPLLALCPSAVGASHVHALLVACVHRATHRQNAYYVDGAVLYESNRLIWLYDIHLLSHQLRDPEWQQFCSLAEQKGLRSVCLEAMQQATSCFHTRFPAFVFDALNRKGPREPVAIYLTSGKLRQQYMDFQALGTARRQLAFLREVFFPAPDYVKAKYAQSNFGVLPWLYVRRATGGVVKALRRSRISAPVPKTFTSHDPSRMAHGVGHVLTHRLNRFKALPVEERRVLLQCALLGPLFWLGLRILGLARIQVRLNSTPVASRRALARHDIDTLGELVAVAARFSPFPSTCLTRSLLLQWLLHRRGIPSDLRLGACISQGALDAHAWVEYDGVPLGRDGDLAARFEPFPLQRK